MNGEGNEEAMNQPEKGAAAVEFIFGLLLTLAVTGLIAWSIWAQALQLYITDLAQEAAQIGALRVPGSSEHQLKVWVERIKDDLNAQIEAFPGSGMLRSLYGGVRIRVDPSLHDSAVLVIIYVCKYRQGFFLAAAKESFQVFDGRDCLGQFKGRKAHSQKSNKAPQTPKTDRLWISARAVFPHPHTLKIYREGVRDLPQFKSRQRLHQIFKDRGFLFKHSLTPLQERQAP